MDDASEDELKDGLLGGEDPRLEIGGSTIEVDTTDFETVDMVGLVDAVRSALIRLQGSGSDPDRAHRTS